MDSRARTLHGLARPCGPSGPTSSGRGSRSHRPAGVRLLSLSATRPRRTRTPLRATPPEGGQVPTPKRQAAPTRDRSRSASLQTIAPPLRAAHGNAPPSRRRTYARASAMRAAGAAAAPGTPIAPQVPTDAASRMLSLPTSARTTRASRSRTARAAYPAAAELRRRARNPTSALRRAIA
jgi:hypothetical protein